MRTLLRFALPLLVILGGIAWTASPMMKGLVDHWFRGDIEARARSLAESSREDLADLAGRPAGAMDLFRRLRGDPHLLAVGFCDRDGVLRQRSPSWPVTLSCPDQPPSSEAPAFSVRQLPDGPALLSAFSLPPPRADGGSLVLIHDLGFVDGIWNGVEVYMAGVLSVLTVVAAAAAILIARLILSGWMRVVRRELAAPGVAPGPAGLAQVPEIASLVDDMQRMLRIGEGARGTDPIRIDWTAESLRHLLKTELSDAEVIVLSNREPYIHDRDETGTIRVRRPASGLITAIEPITRACGGVWIAHGSGQADRDSVDERDHVQVPPDAPSYTLRRLWLSDDEIAGYYEGLANEGLWPLCHLAFVRPVFRADDWEHYVAVNRRFADAVVAEARTANPLVLVQDYHFALVPRMVRDLLPDATIITFWHIPWPNPEVFSICPWREDILQGLLSSSILGFHTRFHCLNFLDTVDRFLACHIDREQSIVSAGSGTTQVRPYPISIEWPPTALAGQPAVRDCRKIVRDRFGLPEDMMLAVGVERLDYTKGIADRIRAVDSLLETHPEWVGRFCLLQIAEPSRTRLAAYQAAQKDARDAANAVNNRFGTPDWLPVRLVLHHHEPDQVFTLFRAADLCIVSSLHDGMNLVAKEFVAARDDEDGVLVLSTFAGASRELSEALIVNPYDSRGMGEALHQGLTMAPDQRRDRMRLMREMVSENNIHFWAGRMLMDAARLRKRQNLDTPQRESRNEQP